MATLKRALALVSICLLAGCSAVRPDDKPPKQAENVSVTVNVSDYFPAESGTRWDYAGSGNEFAAFTAEATHREGNLAQVLVSSGASVAYVYEILPDRVTERLRRAEIAAVENYLHAAPQAPRDILRGPLVEGREWTNTLPDPENPDGAKSVETRRIEAVGVTVDTPAGRFQNAIKVRIRRQTGPDTVEYYALGIGLVRREFLAEEPIISELSRFVRTTAPVAE